MIRTLLAALVLLAAACAPQPAVEDGQPFVGINGKPLVSADGIMDNSVAEALTADPAACTKAGGEIRPVCLMGKPMCVVTFRDAGKECSNGSECGSGKCRTAGMDVQPETVAKGICAPTNDPCGCFQSVEGGKAGYPLCAD